MENKEILKILGNPEEYIGNPKWIDMIFAVRRLMENNDIFEKMKEEWETNQGENNPFELAIKDTIRTNNVNRCKKCAKCICVPGGFGASAENEYYCANRPLVAIRCETIDKCPEELDV